MHPHHAHPGHEEHHVPERHSWWEGGGERIEYLETSLPETAQETLPDSHEPPQDQSWRAWAWAAMTNPVEEEHRSHVETGRSSLDSTSSNAPLISQGHQHQQSGPAQDTSSYTRAPSPSPARRAARWMRGRRELSKVDSVGSEEDDVWEDALERREATERSERAPEQPSQPPQGWRGQVDVGMGR